MIRSSAINTELTAAIKSLRSVIAELSAGHDMAPVQLCAIETLLTRALAAGVTPEEIRSSVDQLLPANYSLNFVDGTGAKKAVLQLWQQRAPVVPTT